MLSAYTISLSVSLPLSGGLSDIYGRRNFFLVGCAIALIGTIVALAAQSTAMMIVAMTIKGIGAGCQQLGLAAAAELFPNKHRGRVQACFDLLALPWSIFGSITGNAMIKYQQPLGFRINFIIGTILNILSIASAWFWYHPPAGIRIPGKSRWRQTWELDWTGVTLMTIGVVVFLCGVGLGGNALPWNGGGTISMVVLGIAFLLAFGVWEWKFAKDPFMAHDLFKGHGRDYPLFLLITFVAGMSLYASAAFWTQQVQGMWTNDPIRIGVLSIPGGFGGASESFQKFGFLALCVEGSSC